MTQYSTIYELVAAQAQCLPDAVAILAPNRKPLTYGHLKVQFERTIAALAQMGIGRHDRVALVLPNGPEMVVGCLAVSACAVSAPLNPAYSELEFASYYSTLNIKALISCAGVSSPAKDVAKAQGLTMIELASCLEGDAGTFTLHSDVNALAVDIEPAQPEDVALIMHTSGTTSKPKTVPLTHINLCASVGNIGTALDLQPSDRCLNIMPLFHSHGLVGACFTSLAVGASVICTPGFNAIKVFNWIKEFQPTWYTAVPTMHQAILMEAEHRSQSDTYQSDTYQSDTYSLRVIRSTSAALPPKVMTGLERAFKVPVIEAYATLEALQITSNPLPPAQQKPRSGGVAVSTEVGIMDASGHLLAPNEIGEIVVRGTNVINGYENNVEANEQAYINGWLRTGDQGYLDEDGYLFLTGRLKEIINRGGETIAPREIDEALLEHPSVLQAIAFAIPHPRLGEDVGAAIVLKPNQPTTEVDIRDFAAARLAGFKVPSRVLFVDDIPKGATGKLQRLGLAATFAAQLEVTFTPPRTPLEELLAQIWTDILGVERVGVHDNFFALGGDSLQAVALIARIERALGKELPPDTIFKALTIAHLANVLSQPQASITESSLVVMQPNGQKPPLFAIHDISGEVFCYRNLALHLDDDRPFYGLRAPKYIADSLSPPGVEAIATHYLQEIRSLQPQGPYFLLGYSFGGLVAFQIAQQLHRQGQRVGFLGLLDTIAEGDRKPFTPYQKITRHVRYFLQSGPSYVLARFNKQQTSSQDLTDNQGIPTQNGLGDHSTASKNLLDASLKAIFQQASQAYTPQVYPGRITFFQPTDRENHQEWLLFDPHEAWSKRTTDVLEIRAVPSGHAFMLKEPHVQQLAEELNGCLKVLHREALLI